MQITISILPTAGAPEQAVAVVASVMPDNDKQVMSTHPVEPGVTLQLDVLPGQILSIEPYFAGA